ncbi:MAG: hypothetical protein KME23_08810 [Goleter apudmare HA4340-LM2]|jgi:hypothetical protein|nr:hypothetical protein [Goleter apudmare HA4340-LM2]
MKILQQITVGVALTSLCLSASVKPSQANPAILAPVALCAGTAGVGCILVGTALIGGGIYYIWQISDGQRVAADAQGNIFRSEYLEDPEEFEKEVIVNVYGSSLTLAQAEERCKRDVSLHGLEFVRVRRRANGTFECVGK